MNRMKMIVMPSERKNLRIANSWISRIATFWDLWRELTWLHIVRLHFWKREFVTDRFFFFFSSAMETLYDEPRYNEVLFLTNVFLYNRNFIVKYIEKNLDITKARYIEHILPVPWHFVISMFHCIVIFTRIGSVETRSTLLSFWTKFYFQKW